MDNHERRVRYTMANRGMTRDDADALVRRWYGMGIADEMLTPAQRRNLARSRRLSRTNGINPQVSIRDEAAQTAMAVWHAADVMRAPAVWQPNSVLVKLKSVNKRLDRELSARFQRRTG